MALLPQSRKRKPYIRRAWTGKWQVYYPGHSYIQCSLSEHSSWSVALDAVRYWYRNNERCDNGVYF